MKKRILIVMAGLLLVASFAFAQDDTGPQAAELVDDEGGVETVTGDLNYTLATFNNIYADPYVILYDLAGNIDRDFEFTAAEDSQVFGRFTSDIEDPPVGYELQLPLTPQGEFRDLDNDDSDDTGVQVYSPAVVTNLWGNPYIDPRDDVFSGYTSVVISDDAATIGELESGNIFVWAPDDEQGFPNGFGEDGLVFTEDDSIVTLPQGWTRVNLDEEPFTFSQAQLETADLIEPESIELDDFSELTYTEAFGEMIDLLEEEYPFTELKDVDWDEKRETYRPQIAEAQENEDVEAYRQVLNDFALSIPDGHMFGPFLLEQFQTATAGGIGIAIRDLDDGRTVVSFVGEESPAAEAGIERGAEVIEIDGQAVDDVIDNAYTFQTFSAPWIERLQKLRYATRFPLEAGEVEITYQNPDADEATTTTLSVVPEQESFRFSSFNQGLTGLEYPVEFDILDSGYGYVKVYSFSDDLPLTTELWDRAMQTFIANDVEGIIVDMRQNGGGYTAVGYQMASYFFDEDRIIEINGFYDDSIGEQFIFEESPERYTPPAPEKIYDGEVVVLIDPACASACEYVSRAMSLYDRAETVGFYPTRAIGGGWIPFFMPEDVQMPNISSTAYDEDLNLIIEGSGVAPTVNVPVTEETLFTDEDVLLNRAEELLDENIAFETQNAGTILIGQQAMGDFEEGVRKQWTLEAEQGDSFDVTLISPERGVDPVLRVYVQGDEDPVAISDNINGTANRNASVELIDIPADFTFVLEVTTVRDAGSGPYVLTVEEIDAPTDDAEAAETTEDAEDSAETEATDDAEASEDSDDTSEDDGAETEDTEDIEETEAPADPVDEADATEEPVAPTEQAEATEESAEAEATEESETEAEATEDSDDA